MLPEPEYLNHRAWLILQTPSSDSRVALVAEVRDKAACPWAKLQEM